MFMGIGALLLLVGAIWMIVVAVQSENSTAAKLIWGLLIFFTGPFAGTIFFLIKKAGLVPLILMWIAVLVYGAGIFTGPSDVLR